MHSSLLLTSLLLNARQGILRSITSLVRSIVLPGFIICTFSLLAPVQHCEAADIPVSGTISSDTTWTMGNTYILTGSVSISAGITLTIENNVIVKFNAGTVIGISGALDTQGTSGNLSYFTDIRDDTVGGDSNGDGGATVPVAGGWGGISIADGGSANLVYTEMRYSGGIKFTYNSTHTYTSIYKSGNSGAITADHFTLKDTSSYGFFILNSTAAHSISDSSFDSIGRNGFFLDNVSNITVQNSTVQNCPNHGISLINSGGTISGNTFQNNVQNGLSVSGFSGSVTGNDFQSNGQYGFYSDGLTHPGFTGNSFSNNTLSPIGLNGDSAGMNVPASNTLDGPITITGGTTTVDANWQSPFTYKLNGLTVGAGTTLTITPPRVVKSSAGAISVNGMLDIPGTADNRVYFTDLRDDTVGGDSNGDGGATVPVAGGWGGISIADGGSANLVYTEMRYSGGIKFTYNSTHTYTSIYKSGNTGAITADHFTLKNTNSNGIFLVNSSAIHSISDSSFDSIGQNGFYLENLSNITVQDSTVQNCGGDGIYMINSSGTISGNTIRNNTRYGIHTSGALTSPAIKNNIIKLNLVGIQTVSSANPVIGGSALNGNDIYGNTNYGAYNGDSGITVSAEYNYWGDASGPYHEVTNPDADGNRVSDYVSYGNFAALPVNEIIPVLSVNITGDGIGSVISSPSGIDCGSDCSETYTIGSQVTLSAVPEGGSVFSGWSGGGCTGAGDCIVNMTQPLTVTAEFKLELIFRGGFEGPGVVSEETP